MKVQIKIDRKIQESDSKNIFIEIKGAKYKLSESIDGKLNINKTSTEDGVSEEIVVYSRYSNEIEVK